MRYSNSFGHILDRISRRGSNIVICEKLIGNRTPRTGTPGDATSGGSNARMPPDDLGGKPALRRIS